MPSFRLLASVLLIACEVANVDRIVSAVPGSVVIGDALAREAATLVLV